MKYGEKIVAEFDIERDLELWPSDYPQEYTITVTGYKLDGELIDLLPMGADDIARCQPIYETMPGWSDSTVGVTDYSKLPLGARQYLERIAEVTGVPIAMVSTSPDRDHTILMRHPYVA